jgi:predicted RNase H-like HicB family nuclease
LSDIYDALDRKVDKEACKGLSSNDFTNVLKNKLEGINLDNYALKNHTHSNYANVNHTHSEYALVNHTHVISDIAGLEEALNRAGVTYTLSKNGNNIILTGSDGSTSTVAISGIDENALKTLIQAKLRLVHGTGNISLIYDGTNLATVPDEKGSSEGGITEDEVKELIKENLDVTHVGDLIKLKYGNTIFGNGTTDMTGEGGGDDDDLPGNILIYFLKTSTSNVPETPVDGQIADPTSPSGTWLDYAPNHETGKCIWMSQIYQTHSRNNYGNWTTPILIDDGQEGGSAGSDTSGI